MTAAAHKITPRADPVAVFIARASARAKLWAAGEFDLHEAVDVLQTAAESAGLVEKLGQDRVQEIMADAFRPVREALGDFDAIPDAPPEEPRNKRAAESTIEALCCSLRTDGVEALQRASTQNRIVELSAAQIATVIERLARARAKHPAITDELLLALGELLP